jgi:hypothetical protein
MVHLIKNANKYKKLNVKMLKLKGTKSHYIIVQYNFS